MGDCEGVPDDGVTDETDDIDDERRDGDVGNSARAEDFLPFPPPKVPVGELADSDV